MKTELKIIRNFIENKNAKTIREIAKGIKADYKIPHIAVQRLISKKIITRKIIGKSSLCSLNEKYFGTKIYEAEDERREEIFKNKNINQLYKEIMSKVKTSSFVLLLFGSYAKGNARKNSDIDVAVISPDFKSPWSALDYLYSKLPYGKGWVIEPVGFSPADFSSKYSILINEIKTYGVEV